MSHDTPSSSPEDNKVEYNKEDCNKENSKEANKAQANLPADTSGNDSEELLRFGLSMPAPLVRELDVWRKDRGYANRSEAVRDLVREALVESKWDEGHPEEAMVGVVTIVYDHTTRQLSDHLTDMQHHAHHISQATLHIHLNPDNCLEVIVLRGPRAEVKALANHLISTKGVLHGKFIPTTTGEDIT